MKLWSHTAFRTALTVVLVMGLLAVASVLIVQRQLERRLLEQATIQLDAEIQNLRALYDQRRVVAVRQAIAFRLLETGQADRVYLLTDRNSDVLAGNLPGWPSDLEADDVGFEVSTPTIQSIEGQRFLTEALTLRGGFSLLVGVSMEPSDQTLQTMRRVFFLFGFAMVICGVGAAFAFARRAQGRMNNVNAFLDTVGTSGTLDARMATEVEHLGPEFAQLGHHIDAMLDRIAHLLDAHHRLGNTVAHEMRTPLARIQARLARLDVNELARAGLDEEIRSTIRLFDSLLSIAQMDAEAHDPSGLSPVNIGQVAEGIVELYVPVAEDTDRQLAVSTVDDAWILGDEGLLAQLISNLIENGLKYTRTGDKISVSVSRTNNRVKLRVADTGPGLEEGTQDTVFAPFSRGTHSASQPGHGLGLSLVRAIALRHGALLRLPKVDKGFAIEMDCILFEEK